MTNLLLICTAYCACNLCTAQWSGGPTASGVMPREGVTCAANAFPFGTKLEIEGVGVRVVQDRMSRRFPRRVDIYVRNHSTALRFGKRELKVRVLSP